MLSGNFSEYADLLIEKLGKNCFAFQSQNRLSHNSVIPGFTDQNKVHQAIQALS